MKRSTLPISESEWYDRGDWVRPSAMSPIGKTLNLDIPWVAIEVALEASLIDGILMAIVDGGIRGDNSTFRQRFWMRYYAVSSTDPEGEYG